MDRVPATAESGKRDLLDLGMLEDPVLDKKGLAGEHRRIRKRFTQNDIPHNMRPSRSIHIEWA